VVLLDRITHPDVDPGVVAMKVLDAMAPSFQLEGRLLEIRPSIGIAVQRVPARDPSRLMQTADEAMYHAKHGVDARFAVLEC
jgi:predicted signal transduction protein with EAL and GGDEF domain